MIELAIGLVLIVIFFMGKQRLGQMLNNTLDMGVNVTEVGRLNTDQWKAEQEYELQQRMESFKTKAKVEL